MNIFGFDGKAKNFRFMAKKKTIKSNDDENSAAEDQKFIVFGINISNWTSTSQYVFCTIGVMSFLILYGLLQEHVVMKTFNRSLGWFVTLLQLSGYAFCAWLQSLIIGTRIERRIPLKLYFILSLLQVIMQGFTNLSMRYLNYPAKMLFKSSRVLVTMIFGSLFRKKIYPSKDYIVALSMAAGLTLFVMADAKSSPLFDINGVFIITIALAADGTILNLQEYCFKTYNATHDELIYYSYMGASIFLLIINICCGIFFKDSYIFILFFPFILINFIFLTK